ncbi:hypothetical protein [Burkholderia ubonensis]|uniref:hypothetical protein n=1 Tax=Burkholderia ubonensis TaxID=101571 RepID=UPI000F57E35B|nr:hypothetical protein [Burkholderia ubonensis]
MGYRYAPYTRITNKGLFYLPSRSAHLCAMRSRARNQPLISRQVTHNNATIIKPKEPKPFNFEIKSGIREINHTTGNSFKPNASQPSLELNRFSSNTSGIIAIPSKNHVGHEVLHFSPPIDLKKSAESIGTDLWRCAKEYYGLTGTTILIGAGGIPIKKSLPGHPVIGNSSKYTNILSDIGIKFFPRPLLPHGPMANFAKKTFGTVRVFGVLVRACGVGTIAMGVIDAALIGKCAYDAKHGNQISTNPLERRGNRNSN